MHLACNSLATVQLASHPVFETTATQIYSQTGSRSEHQANTRVLECTAGVSDVQHTHEIYNQQVTGPIACG